MKSILITGGTGFFGKSFVKHILANKDFKRIVIFSRDEFKQFEMQNELKFNKNYSKLRFFVGDIRDLDRLKIASKNIDIIIHAAALKHVPTAEYNPFEFVKTNIIGSENVVKASLDNSVKKIISISTDKAVSPLNLYGATKLVADKIIISANQYASKNRSIFSVVRYGNVINSRGSVIPFFREFIKTNKFFPITNSEMTRFWISIEDCIKFVEDTLQIMIGGEIFIPKIPSMKITELARAIDPKLPLKEIGIRPGEKIHEIMISNDDARNTFETKDRYIIEPEFLNLTKKRLKIDNRFKEKIKKVSTDFFYSSGTNKKWLSRKDIEKTLKKIYEKNSI